MTPRWKVRKYRAGDEAGINDLFLRVFGIRRSPEEWRWKFLKGPRKERSLIFLAHDGDRVVGQYAVIFSRFLCGGREVLAAQPVDNMIDPEYRQGLGRARIQRALYRAIQNDPLQAVTAMGYGFPNREAYRIGKKLLGYRDIGPVHVRLRSLTWARHIRRLAGSDGPARMGGRAHAWVHRRRLCLGPSPPPGMEVRHLSSFDDRFNRLWARAAPSFGVLAIRDRNYLDWRYGGRPSGKCTILGLEKGRSLLGYAVLTHREGPVRFGLVADILCLPGRGRAESLVLRALDHFLKTGCDMAACWSPAGGRYEDLFKKYFPRRLPDPLPAVTRVYDRTLDPSLVSDISRWHITMGDADGV